MQDLIILKIGGSVITYKFSKKPKVNFKNLKRISKEIASIYNSLKFPLVLIHGVGPFGHVIVRKTGIDKGIKNKKQLRYFAETQRLQNELNVIVTGYLIKAGLPAIPCQASSFVVMESGRIIKMDSSAIEGLLKMGMVPVLFGVPAFDRDQKCSILSGDQIAPFLAAKLNAKRIICATDVDGVFTSDPHKNPNAKLMPRLDNKNIVQVGKWVTGSTAIDVTGGMLGKVLELSRIKIESRILNGLVPGNIVKVFNGEKIGTIIKLS
jgi:isopentenyl phosphate kinase